MIGKERKFEDNSKYINHNIVKGESEGRTHTDDVRQHQRRSDYYTFSMVQTEGMHDVPIIFLMRVRLTKCVLP